MARNASSPSILARITPPKKLRNTYTGESGLLTEPLDTMTSLLTFSATHAAATFTSPALSTSWGVPPLGDADAAKMAASLPRTIERNASSLAFATSPARVSTRLAFVSPEVAKSPALEHATTRAPAAAACATHRLPVLPFAPNTTTEKDAAGGVSEAGSDSGSEAAPAEARDVRGRRDERAARPREDVSEHARGADASVARAHVAMVVGREVARDVVSRQHNLPTCSSCRLFWRRA